MEKVLIIAEHHKGKLTPASKATVTAGSQLCESCDVLLVGKDVDAVSQECAKLKGVGQVLTFLHPSFEHVLAENISRVIIKVALQYGYILAPSNTFGKNFMPNVAAKLDVAQLSDITEIVDHETFVRPIYAGNAFEKIRLKEKVKVMTIRPTAFEQAQQQDTQVPIENLSLDYEPHPGVSFESEQTPELERPELTSAKTIISGGRGLGSAENFKLIESIADQLNAAIGASRAAVDAGFVPNDYQVGQTGKIVAPDLYIAVGISGAIQHIAGMKDSKVIVAINKDEEAPIFQIADYGLVGDLFEILPQMEKAIAEIKD